MAQIKVGSTFLDGKLIASEDYVTTGLATKAALSHAATHITGGSDVIPNVVAGGNAGLMTGADKTKLNGIAAGAQVNVATNLGNTPAATTVALTSSTGTGTTLPAATTSLAGVLTGADKTKLNGIESGAQVNTVTSVAGQTGAVTLASSDVGLGNVLNYGVATEAEAQAGTATNKYMTPQRVNQAIQTLAPAPVTASQAQAEAGTDNATFMTPLRTSQAISSLQSITSVNSQTGAVTLSASDVGAVPTTRTVNSKALSSDISLTAADVGASASSHSHITIDIEDCRSMSGTDGSTNYNPTPSNTQDKTVSSVFSTGYTGGSWRSAITMKGWTGSYVAWQLQGPAGTAADDNLYFRSGAGATWRTAQKIWMDGQINTAFANTSYTTRQVRNFVLSTGNPSGGSNGDVWIKYV